MNTTSTAKLLRLPAFQWSDRQVFPELRAALARRQQRPLPNEEFGKITGVSKATAYRWLEELEHPNITALFACLERLPAKTRHQFVASRCREFPDLDHPALAHSPRQVGKLLELVQKERGLTIVTGSRRGFVFNAIGHACRRFYSPRQLAGLDIIRPDCLVPMEFCKYVDPAGMRALRQIVLTEWPKILTTSAKTIFLNELWMLEDLRDDIMRLAARRHVVLACADTPNLKRITPFTMSVHLVNACDSKCVLGGIRVNSRRLRSPKFSEKLRNPN